jgi:hypothetical protein
MEKVNAMEKMITLDAAMESLKAYRAEHGAQFGAFNIYSDSAIIKVSVGDVYVNVEVDWQLTDVSEENDVGIWNKCALRTRINWGGWGSVSIDTALQFQSALAWAMTLTRALATRLPNVAYYLVDTHEAREEKVKINARAAARSAVMDVIAADGLTKGMRVGKPKSIQYADMFPNVDLFNFSEGAKTFTVKVQDGYVRVERIA